MKKHTFCLRQQHATTMNQTTSASLTCFFAGSWVGSMHILQQIASHTSQHQRCSCCKKQIHQRIGPKIPSSSLWLHNLRGRSWCSAKGRLCWSIILLPTLIGTSNALWHDATLRLSRANGLLTCGAAGLAPAFWSPISSIKSKKSSSVIPISCK